jgi:aldehyde dehydrogenase (NAD+)
MAWSSAFNRVLIGGLAIANDSACGLNGSVFNSDFEPGVAVARRTCTGTVERKGSPAGFHASMGGVKSSRLGREAGPEGFETYVELKSIGLPEAYAETPI